MMKCRGILPALLAFLFVFATAISPTASELPVPRWHTSYATAQAEAQKTGKPIFVVFR